MGGGDKRYFQATLDHRPRFPTNRPRQTFANVARRDGTNRKKGLKRTFDRKRRAEDGRFANETIGVPR